jgi:hypothetical protein
MSAAVELGPADDRVGNLPKPPNGDFIMSEDGDRGGHA